MIEDIELYRKKLRIKAGSRVMPIIRAEMWEGRTLERRKELVEVLSMETARIIGCDPSSVYVILDEVKKENWGAGGQLCSIKYPD